MKLQYVDSMRGIAILMVILVHSSHPITDIKTFDWLIASYGQMGVQLFFVASAFTLCLSADYRKYECNKIRNYAIRRYFRIAPLYYFGIIVYLVLDSLNNYFYTSNFILSE
ncbi:MAG: acyltransferase family protein, partial [Bacteroidales bacterium]|nr:acyltransferase family protein [Bacteroidales bacterium]